MLICNKYDINIAMLILITMLVTLLKLLFMMDMFCLCYEDKYHFYISGPLNLTLIKPCNLRVSE